MVLYFEVCHRDMHVITLSKGVRERVTLPLFLLLSDTIVASHQLLHQLLGACTSLRGTYPGADSENTIVEDPAQLVLFTS